MSVGRSKCASMSRKPICDTRGQPMRSKEPVLVRQELYGLLLAHYLVRWWMHQSAREGDLDPDRLSFTHAVEVLDTACSEFALVAREELPRLQARLLADLREPTPCCPLAASAFILASSSAPIPLSIASVRDSRALPSKSRASLTFFLFKWHCPLVVCRRCHEAIHAGMSTQPIRKQGPESCVTWKCP